MNKNNKKILVIILVLFVVLSGAFILPSISSNKTIDMKAEVESKIINYDNESKYRKPKYVFLFIGDGNGLPQISLTENYNEYLKTGKIGSKKLNFSTFPSQGFVSTYSADSYITDSAAAGTAIATGEKTNLNVIGLDTEEKELKSIAKIAKEEGMKVGIVSSVTLNHATPAAFYSNTDSRGNYHDIALDMVESDFDYFGGGLLIDPAKNGVDVYEKLHNRGYKITAKLDDFDKLSASDEKVIALSPDSIDGSLPYQIDQTEKVLSLADFTEKGIEILDNEDGFFMMIESGKIDWASHANDAVTAIGEVNALADAVNEALKFYNEHPEETLILVTADHETGGLTLGSASTKYKNFYDVLTNQRISYDLFKEKVDQLYEEMGANLTMDILLPEIEKAFGLKSKASDDDIMLLTADEKNKLDIALEELFERKEDKKAYKETYSEYGKHNPIVIATTHILNKKAGIDWTTFTHTGVPVPIYAKGSYNILFNGYFDNTDIFYKLEYLIKE